MGAVELEKLDVAFPNDLAAEDRGNGASPLTRNSREMASYWTAAPCHAAGRFSIRIPAPSKDWLVGLGQQLIQGADRVLRVTTIAVTIVV
jgi:hypothetical protein